MSPYYSTLSEFVHMNGYGSYVWVCYGLVFGCLFLLIIHAKNERKSAIAKLTRQKQSTKLTNKQRKQILNSSS